MWRRHSIAARKASGDAKKSQTYAKIGKIIQIAAKKWADASMNPSLDLALQKARYHWLPREVIDKAILKWSGQLESEDLQEVVFEWYWPNGSALIIKTLTENTNRTSANVRIVLTKLGGSLGKPGSVAWQFEETWVFVIDGKSEFVKEKGKDIEKVHTLDFEKAELELMDFPIKDVESEEGKLIVTCEKTNFSQLQKDLKENNFHVVEGDLHYLAKDTVSLWNEDKEKLLLLVEQLEEDEDVDVVWNNMK